MQPYFISALFVLATCVAVLFGMARKAHVDVRRQWRKCEERDRKQLDYLLRFVDAYVQQDRTKMERLLSDMSENNPVAIPR